MAEIPQIAQLLSETLSSNVQHVRYATQQLHRLSLSFDFPFSLLSIITGDSNQAQKIAAASCLKNLVRRNVCGEDGRVCSFSREFKERLLESLLRVEFPVLRVLVEAFHSVVDVEFVKRNEWHELVHQLRLGVQNSDIISGNAHSKWRTLNALKVLQTLIRPFQYFLNPKVAKEPVPPQLELIAIEILVPLLAIFHSFTEQVLATKEFFNDEVERVILIVCKCIYFTVKSYMPSSIVPLLPLFCCDLCTILNSLSLEESVSSESSQQVRLKSGKRSLLIFCVLVTRHRKYSDKLMPNILKCVLRIARCSTNIPKLDCFSERVISLALDVISHVLETGPGWRLVSPHFSSLLDTAIFPALVMNMKDILDWEEDADEFISKYLPSDLEEVSGWREDLFIARKSSMNLLGVISMSKGPPVRKKGRALLKRKQSEKKGKDLCSSVGELLVFPFLSKFSIPHDANASDTSIMRNYFGVLMGYGASHDFLGEQNPDYTATLITNRVLPLYKVSTALPYLLAAANWTLGELSSCLPEEIQVDVYSVLLKALEMPDYADASYYPVRATAAGAILKLLDNDYPPSDWSSLLRVIVSRIGNEEREISMLFQLLSSVVDAGDEEVAIHAPVVIPLLVEAIAKLIPASPAPWSQAVIQGFVALAVIAKSWQAAAPKENKQKNLTVQWATDQKSMAKAFSVLLQQAWLLPKESEGDDSSSESCIDDASTLLWFIMRSTTDSNSVMELKVPELLSVWARLIANWHGWEEVEGLAIFDCIKEVVTMSMTHGLQNFLVTKMPSPPAPPVPQRSIIESIAAFVCEAISQYSSAVHRACICIHVLLHLPRYSSQTEEVKSSLVASFTHAAASRFRELQSKSCSLRKPLLLAISSCYLCNPDTVHTVLETINKDGFVVWMSALNSIPSGSFEENTLAESEIKLSVVTLAKVIEQLSTKGSPSALLWHCFGSLLMALVRLKEIQENNSQEEETEEICDEDEEDTDCDTDEDSDDDIHEETEEEFLERYAEAAASLENGTFTDELDSEDFDEELELGLLEEVDCRTVLQTLLEKYDQILIQKPPLPPKLISRFLGSFPEYSILFH
ncbi:hypothetical protein RND81_05G137800 [Saponaria officinalis]|uniref:Importin N-terminal domain-containing protein n=1 Tax=Saponaria officinalis TaxID=3572 RepID=A0AAW1KYW4_SAPOF